MIPQANGLLTKIAGGGFSEDPGADVDDDAQPTKFQGSTPALYEEKQERRRGAEGRDVVVRRILIVHRAAIDGIELQADDVLSFSVAGEAQSGKLQTFDLSPAPLEIAGDPTETVRLELEPR